MQLTSTFEPFEPLENNVTDVSDARLSTAKDGDIAIKGESVSAAFSSVSDPLMNTFKDGELASENATLISTLVFTSTSYTAYYEKVIFCVIGTLGFLGNSLVMFVFLRSPNLRRKITNMLILNQSVIDLLASTFVGLNNGFDDIGWIKEPGPLAYYFCKLWLSKYSIWGSMVVSTFNLVALTFERYFALIYPMVYKRYFTKTGARITICIVWITGLAFMSFVVWSTELKGTVCSTWTEWPSQLFQNVFGVIVIFIEFIIPIFIMGYCYGRIALMIHKEAKMADASQHREQQMLKARFNVIRTLLLVSICFFVCWVWDSIYFLLYNLGIPVSSFTSPIYQFSVVACFANCCINPFIYVFSYEAFQKSMKPAFCCGVKERKESQYLSGTMSTRVSTVNSDISRESNESKISSVSSLFTSKENVYKVHERELMNQCKTSEKTNVVLIKTVNRLNNT